MRITDIKVIGQNIVSSQMALITVETDEGITGIGSTSAPTQVIAALIEGNRGLRELLIGEDPTDTNRLWLKMAEGWQAQRGRGGEGGVGINAMGAVDIALWDIAGKARGLPIYKLLGGAVQDQIMVYASTSRADRRYPRQEPWIAKTTELMVQEAKEYVEQGFKAIKWGWGNYFNEDGQEALEAIREAIGPDIHLMLDFGCPAYLRAGWNVKDAIQVAEICGEYDLFFLEEALRPYDVRGFQELTRNSPVKIATGESLTTVGDCKRFIDDRAIDIIQPDIQQMGMSQFLRVARLSEEAGMPCIPHGPWSAVLVAGHLSALAAFSNGIIIEYPGFASFEESSDQKVRTQIMNETIIETPPIVRDGYLQLPEGPGLGLGNYVLEVIEGMEQA
ncbi:mandelate racemase/muconate lactonizing enzyme family protein [Dehalococcoidia bacterium]|nr:mandelate racemase/muconate lactonizing enzyme family protein [Dehalococcoidia bacterium]